MRTPKKFQKACWLRLMWDRNESSASFAVYACHVRLLGSGAELCSRGSYRYAAQIQVDRFELIGSGCSAVSHEHSLRYQFCKGKARSQAVSTQRRSARQGAGRLWHAQPGGRLPARQPYGFGWALTSG